MNARAWLIVLVAAAVACGCSSRVARYGAAERIEPPRVVARPVASPDDPQLAALVLRDTAGLEPDVANAWVDTLDELVETARRHVPEADALLGVRAYERTVYVELVDSANPNLELSVMFDAHRGNEPHVGNPRYSEDEPFDWRAVDFTVPAALIDAITTRYPALRVTDVILSRAHSGHFDLAWRFDVDDARGSLATIYADPDGTVIAVDPM